MFSLIKKKNQTQQNQPQTNKLQLLKEPQQNNKENPSKPQTPKKNPNHSKKRIQKENLPSNLCSLTAHNSAFEGRCKWSRTKTCFNMFGKG